MLISGIYKIINLVTEDCYIGSAVNLNRRKNQHYYSLRNNKHFSLHLQRSFNKYKEENFTFEILAKCPKEYLIKLEQWFLDNLKPIFNKRIFAENNLSLVFSDEHRKKIGEANRKRVITQEQKDKMSKSLTGRKLSKATKEKMASYRQGENNPSAKLNLEIVKEIRNSDLAVKDLAIKYNVAKMTIYKIKNNKIWKEV